MKVYTETTTEDVLLVFDSKDNPRIEEGKNLIIRFKKMEDGRFAIDDEGLSFLFGMYDRGDK
jgi:hypothetical protein